MEENTKMSDAPMETPKEMPMDTPKTDTSSTIPATPAAKEEAKKDNSKMMLVVGVILLIVCVVCCAVSFLFKDAFKLTSENGTDTTPTPTATGTTTPTPTEEEKVSNRPTNASGNGFDTFDDNGIVIKHPNKWEIVEGTSTALIFQVVSPQSSATDAFRENLNVTTEDISSANGITLKEYYDLSVKNLKTIYPELEIVSETDTVLAGEDAKEIVYTIEANGTTVTQDVKIMQIITIVGEDAYVVTYSATVEAFGEYTNQINFMINSFEVK